MNKRLGVISDTHGEMEGWSRALGLWSRIDGVLHAGDVLSPGAEELADSIRTVPFPVIISKGNIDSPEDEGLLGRPLMAPYCTVWWNGLLILVGHGDHFPRLRETALSCGADLVVYGHTHISSIVREGGTIFLNPGSASLPKGRDPASAALLDEEGISIFILQNGELLHREPWQPDRSTADNFRG